MRPAPWRTLLLLAWAVLTVLSAVLLSNVQRQGEDDLKQRFENRAGVAAHFTQTYVRDLLDQERRVAERELGGASVSAGDLARTTNLFGQEAAVLLDARGRALGASPTSRKVIGQNLARKHEYLRAATTGQTAVSKVITSGTKGVPTVGFATPFATRHGRRVYSGAFDVKTTPIGSYLRNTSSQAGTRIYLLDAAGMVVASSRGDLNGVNSLTQADPELARPLAHSVSSETGDGKYYASLRVAGTPWRLVMSVPRSVLFEPTQGVGRYVPWLLWAGFVLGGLACAVLVSNLIASRRSLRAANENLDRLARIDSVTGLYNRRQMQDSLDSAVANSARYDQPLSVLMIDLDRFKAINDTHGHAAGDEVLRVVAESVRASLRGGDLVGRWGGEEFLAILPSTGASGAEVVAERVRHTVSSAPVVEGDRLIPVSVSIGVAMLEGEEGDELVAQADAAMYAAKTAGRDAVHVAR